MFVEAKVKGWQDIRLGLWHLAILQKVSVCMSHKIENLVDSYQKGIAQAIRSWQDPAVSILQVPLIDHRWQSVLSTIFFY